MHAMVLNSVGARLVPADLPDPVPAAGEIRVTVRACGVCRTDLHVVDGDLPNSKLPLVPGHEIVGIVDRIGPGVTGLSLGDRACLALALKRNLPAFTTDDEWKKCKHGVQVVKIR